MKIVRLLGLTVISVLAAMLALIVVELGLRAYLSIQYPDVPTRIVNNDFTGYYFRSNHEFKAGFITNELGVVRRDSLFADADTTMLLIGDSMLEGTQVGPNENLSELLASRFVEGCRCINLGISGFSPFRYQMAYRFFQPSFNPQYVFVFFYILNDFNDDARLFHDDRLVFDGNSDLLRIKPTFDYDARTVWGPTGLNSFSIRQHWRDSGGFITLQVVRSLLKGLPAGLGPGEALAERTDNYASRHRELLRNNVLSIFKEDYSPEDLADIERTQQLLLNMRDEVENNGAEFVVVLVPFAGQVPGQIAGAEKDYGMAPGDLAGTQPQDLMGEWLARNGIPFADLLPAFVEHSDLQLFGSTDKHFARDGHRIAAEALYTFLSSELGIP